MMFIFKRIQTMIIHDHRQYQVFKLHRIVVQIKDIDLQQRRLNLIQTFPMKMKQSLPKFIVQDNMIFYIKKFA